MHEALQRAIREADGAGSLGAVATGRGAAEHPVCGDRVEVELRVVDGAIVDLAWRASGCPATLAVAASARAALRDAPTTAAAARLAAWIAARGGLAAHQRHALRIVVDAVASAAGQQSG